MYIRYVERQDWRSIQSVDGYSEGGWINVASGCPFFSTRGILVCGAGVQFRIDSQVRALRWVIQSSRVYAFFLSYLSYIRHVVRCAGHSGSEMGDVKVGDSIEPVNITQLNSVEHWPYALLNTYPPKN